MVGWGSCKENQGSPECENVNHCQEYIPLRVQGALSRHAEDVLIILPTYL